MEQVNDELKQLQQQKQELEVKLKHANAKLRTKGMITESKPALCVTCYETTMSKLFLPCKHAGSCGEFTTKLMQKSKLCPWCRTEIKAVIGIKVVH